MISGSRINYSGLRLLIQVTLPILECIVLNVSQYVATMIKNHCFPFDDDQHRFSDSGSRFSLAAVTLALFGASS